LVITQQLRGLESFLSELCPSHGSGIELTSIGDRVVKIACQYEGHARIISDLLKLQKNIAKLEGLGYEKAIIVFASATKKEVILTVETCDYLP